jgi:hypothetical protein
VKKLFWLLPVAFILCACPFESTVPLAAGPAEPVDSSLFGYWYGIVKDGSDFFGIEALDIKKESDSVYSIIRYGKAVKGDIILPDTAYFTGYISYIGNQRFMNIKGSVVIVNTKGKKKVPEVITQQVYYLSALEMHNDTLNVRTISESFSPIKKIFKSPEELKNAVISVMEQQKNVYDDLYSLHYHKIPKPQPLKPF